MLLGGNLGAAEGERLCQFFTIRSGEIGHALWVEHEFFVYPVAHLVGAELWPAPFRQERVELERIEIKKVFFVVRN